jgi:hypothetical protein
MKLTPAEIAQHRKENRCFHCNDFYTNSHRDVCKRLLPIEVVHDTDEEEAPGDPAEPTISLHALTGIQPRSGHTMQLRVSINDIVLLALLDSGSTHNFVNTEAAA